MRSHTENPAALLEAVFIRIERERMAGMPLLNPALSVQALGFERWQGCWLGALVTPWFLNLVLLPADAEAWQAAADGERVFHHFAAGNFAFLGNHEPDIGAFQTCSLFSPMHEFTDQASATATALAALLALQQAPAASTVIPILPAMTDTTAANAGQAWPCSAGAEPVSLSRRALFLGGRARSSGIT